MLKTGTGLSLSVAMPAAVRRAQGEPFQGGSVVLVLSRKTGERIVVPECGVAVTVVAVTGNKIRLGIEAPAGVPILRSELIHRQAELCVTPDETEVAGEAT